MDGIVTRKPTADDLYEAGLRVGEILDASHGMVLSRDGYHWCLYDLSSGGMASYQTFREMYESVVGPIAETNEPA